MLNEINVMHSKNNDTKAMRTEPRLTLKETNATCSEPLQSILKQAELYEICRMHLTFNKANTIFNEANVMLYKTCLMLNLRCKFQRSTS